MSSPQNFSETEPAATSPALRRRGNWATRLSLYALAPMGLLAALWITAGRALFGAGGDLVPVFAVSFGSALALIYLLAAFFSFRETSLQEAGAATGLPPVTALVAASGWVLALIFGMFTPDRIDGRTVSAAASLFGADFVGLSAGFGNTTGILTFAFAIAVLLMSIASWRRAKEAARGIDAATREQLEREESMYDFLD